MSKFNVETTYNVYSACIDGADSLEAAVAKAQSVRAFYEPMYPGTVRVAITLTCERCKGNGRIAKGRKNVRFPKYTDCPECKGAAAFPVPAVV